MPDEPESINLTHSPPRGVAAQYPDDSWNRLLRRIYNGIFVHFFDAGVNDPANEAPHLTYDKVHEICTRLQRYPESLITVTAATELSEGKMREVLPHMCCPHMC